MGVFDAAKVLGGSIAIRKRDEICFGSSIAIKVISSCLAIYL